VVGAKIFSKKIGRRIKHLRTDAKLSQEKLAEMAGLNRAYIGYIERGERNPTIPTLQKIAKQLNVSIDEFFKF
jgi:transcriptional regulator with XRE-family HTH domain